MQYVLARLAEPSSWAAVGTAATLIGVHLDASWLQQIAMFGAAAATFAAFVLKEKGIA